MFPKIKGFVALWWRAIGVGIGLALFVLVVMRNS